MSEGSQFIDIVLFALVAVFLGLRLRSVLGKRTGNEQQPPSAPFRGGPPPREDRGNVIDLEPNRPQPGRPAPMQHPPGSLAAKIAEVQAKDSSFAEEQFTAGAVAAFEMIVRAFANDDEAALRPLLAPDVYENFAQAIQNRRRAGEQCMNQLVRITSADIVDAAMDGSFARITVKYVTDQIIVIKDAKGAVIEGDPSRHVEIVDIWTFARDMRSRDPNWLLVATSSPDA